MSVRLALARVGRWPRIAAAAACLLLAAVTALDSAGREAVKTGPDTRVLVVAARALPVGHVLARRDLTATRWPNRVAPPGSSNSPGDVVGRTLAGPLAAGEPVTPRRLLDPGLTVGLGPDAVAVSVDIDTDVRGLIGAGATIDLLAIRRADALAGGPDAGAVGADRVAERVRVLAVLGVAPGPSTVEAGGRLVLAVTRAEAVRIAALRPVRAFTAVVASP